jgi:hypothetical protein
MTAVTHPTPQQVRDWMARQVAEHTPPPTPEQIRQELGWHLLAPDRNAPAR